ncbi:hypothetical protein GYMLUDRAFT_167130 [Collybiopsis luxurians FD-317 M1]|uniref:Uncharacterized protein n=1 Tax=Collybiopsis luxurians FD-317 M1 TaxID=944289 RepID=A0A0D0CPU3_9AGAR|nr:hypothetical protein GYMLUDRAFT_167130 [Collybiopsis luxurians FD-317 M1]
MLELTETYRSALANYDSNVTEWFNSAFDLLNVDFGPEYASLLLAWIKFEQRHGFNSPKHGLSTKEWPSELRTWIQNSRKGVPPQFSDVRSLKSFSETVWVWWRSLQPVWRGVASNGRPAENVTYRKTWTTLDKHGKSGWLGLLICLFWWKRGLENLDQTSKQELELDWLLAVKDMRDMLEGLLHQD